MKGIGIFRLVSWILIVNLRLPPNYHRHHYCNFTRPAFKCSRLTIRPNHINSSTSPSSGQYQQDNDPYQNYYSWFILNVTQYTIVGIVGGGLANSTTPKSSKIPSNSFLRGGKAADWRIRSSWSSLWYSVEALGTVWGNTWPWRRWRWWRSSLCRDTTKQRSWGWRAGPSGFSWPCTFRTVRRS